MIMIIFWFHIQLDFDQWNIIEYMQQLSPSYFQFLELPITHELKHAEPPQQTQQELIEFFPKRVSQKLLLNKLRKLAIQQKKHRQKQLLVEKRLTKEKDIFEQFRRKQIRAQERREDHLRIDSIQAPLKSMHEDELSQEKLSKFHASEAIISKCRQKVEQKKQQYVARIQNKTRERHQKAEIRRRMLRQNVEKVNDDIHLEEWRQYETRILQKHKDQRSPPDRLYQEYKKKREVLGKIMGAESKQNVDLSLQPQRQTAPEVVKSDSSKTILFRTRKVEYFGVHQGDSMKKTEKDILRMRKFIEEHSCAIEPAKDEQLLQKFEYFLIKDILSQ